MNKVKLGLLGQTGQCPVCGRYSFNSEGLKTGSRFSGKDIGVLKMALRTPY